MTSRYSARACSKVAGSIRLDPRQDLVLGSVRVDLGGCGPPGRPVGRQLLVPDGQDLVGGEAIEGPERDELVQALAPEREVVTRVRQLLTDPLGVLLEGALGPLDGALQAEQRRVPGLERLPPGLDDDVEETWQAIDGVELQLQPEGDRVASQSVPDLVQRDGCRLQSCRDGHESVGQRREVAHEEQEDGIADLLARRDPSLPQSMDLAVEDRPPGAQHRELPLDPIRLGQIGRIERFEVDEILPLELDELQPAIPRHVPQAFILIMDAEICREDGLEAQ